MSEMAEAINDLSDDDDGVEQDEHQCGKPCPPNNPCEECHEYWDRMRSEGYWNNRTGWTSKGMREMLK